MNTTRLYLVTMFTIVALDILDKLLERYGVTVKEFDPIPDGPIVIGRVESIWRAGVRCSPRFLIVKIPFIKTWGIKNLFVSPIPEYGFRSHRLMWIEGWDGDAFGMKSFYGWRIEPPLEG